MATTATRPGSTRARGRLSLPALEANPLWYKDAIIYQTHVRAFFDSNADGVGDFAGLTRKLDYLQDLGVTAVWILPFYPSPLKDDGYDIADYGAVNPIYGDMRDVRAFVREAHRRGLRVITELVFNHTSDQHEWFQRARHAKLGSAARDFYVWSDTPDKYPDVRVIFKDFETSNWTWDPVANAYYWHRFYAHQPDLNFDNPKVHEALFRVLDNWMALGVDGLRLDAIPYLYEREGTNGENLPETHGFLKKLRAHIDARFADKMLLAEANQWPEDAAAYFGDGDECHMNFHFPLMPRMFMALRMEDRFPIVDILNQTPTIPDNAQWAIFLRNHDELTLEMVTDEERDYMYRVYAHDPQMRINLGIRRRLAPLLGNNRRRIELMNGLLFSLPGTPVIYYGDEIGMGDNIYLGDRNGVRTPMQWSGDRNAGFSTANRQRLYFPVITDPEYHYEAINVDAQQNNPSSLLWWMKRVIALRKQHPAFSRGTFEFLQPDNRKALAFLRRTEGETLLVVANLSRFAQPLELDLSEFNGMTPVELFSRNDWPRIGELPYFITLGPHSFYWFAIEPQRADFTAADGQLPAITLSTGWQGLGDARSRNALVALLPAYLRSRRWFGGKARRIKSVAVTGHVPLPFDDTRAEVAILQVDYTEGDPETYILPLAFAPNVDGAPAERAQAAPVARVESLVGGGMLYDAFTDPAFARALLSGISGRRRWRDGDASMVATPGRAFRELRGGVDANFAPQALRGEQSNTSVIFGDRFILKLFRKLDDGLNPDLEIGRYLTEEAGFTRTAPLAGSIELQRGGGQPATLGILHGFVPNEGDAWRYTLDELGRFFERALAQPALSGAVPLATAALLEHAGQEPPELARETIDIYLDEARLLGQRTAEMHLALAAKRDDSAFAPEPLSTLYQRAIYQSFRVQAGAVFALLRKQLDGLPDGVRAAAERVLAGAPAAERGLRAIVEHKIDATRTRIHGDYHLGQVLFTGGDFVIIDFEGEPARALSERRNKRSPLRDVAGMLRSFHYAAIAALNDEVASGMAEQPEAVTRLEGWACYWRLWASAAFLGAYLKTAGNASFIPRDREQLRSVLDSLTLNKAIYELGYELNNRPDWVGIPLAGILELIGEG